MMVQVKFKGEKVMSDTHLGSYKKPPNPEKKRVIKNPATNDSMDYKDTDAFANYLKKEIRNAK